ncbi:primosomal protein N' [Rubrivivax benzoatilyticus]|uniref:Replication restart protein PriA n=1 Tax=Rubrivivax benzoatilyticus TaxID=316997 RepID=A0ABX0HWY9_9BURK|nr:primosomal protein N' [Rubrivivax benzoatilyticus]EGJ12029.1 primosomal protein N' [Rubrivivax benzoatilyticus JA2 = ATCC BAA-35]NHK98890.1 primosomal protein N' [Rubrivivax benzoatilyticus]NHL24392.1 primosomal protein N' [Rubrivivax benzoatilyticus]
MTQRIAVAVETPQHTGVGVLDYLAEQAWPPGTLLRVPLGRREVPGIVWHREGDAELADDALRPAGPALEALPPLGDAWRRLVEFAAGYYQRGVGELALSVLPPELRKLDDVQLARRVAKLAKLAPPPAAEPPPRPEPSAEQQAALAALAESTAPALLHGVTGSGKTEVYLRAAEQALDAGRQVLVLVPEINLTPQLEARFAARFPGRRLVSLHSALTPAQRLKNWLQAHLGTADLVLGTRLAVFASLPRLGLVVVDEEHDPSFKQQEGARYSARDLAVWRAHDAGVPVLLGSATPSLETWQRVQEGRYRRLALDARIGGGAMPRVRVFDMSRLPRQRGVDGPPLAPPVLDALRQRLERGEQSLLLLNRRGYAPVLHCGECGWKSGCPHCSAWRVFHKADRTLRCHHCGFTERVPRACPDCGNQDIAPIGRGTEKLAEQLAELLPEARVARIDADSTRGAGALEQQLGAVHAGEVDVLVGTQMVAKGHDFRRITLVVAVNPDSALFASDFRAPERLFALLMQAAGRAGRDAEQAARSEMWIQTWNPQHALFDALKRHDYAAFAASQLDERRSAGLPPFSHLALLRAEARSAEVATAFLDEAATLAEGIDSIGLYPAVPPAVSRVADVERVQMLVESTSRPALQRFLAGWLPQLHALRPHHKGLIRWAVDVDPLAI